MFRVTPSATPEHNLGWLDSSSMPHVLRRFLCPSLTEAPFPPPELPGFLGTTTLCLAKILSGPEINSSHTFLSRDIC